MPTKLPQCGTCNNKTSTMWKVCYQNFHYVEIMLKKLPKCGKYAKKNFHNVETMVTKLPQCGNYANKTSTMWKLNDKDNHISNLMSKDSYSKL